MQKFANRREAGRLLARKLAKYAGRSDVLILALPRGGVPVAYEVAQALHVPLDVFVIRKIGAPDNEELAIGALASGGTRILNEELIYHLGISHSDIERITDQEQAELQRREHLYREDRPLPELQGKTVILVDDGLATGASMIAAIKAIHRYSPNEIIVAVPVASESSLRTVRAVADDCVAVIIPEALFGIGWYYIDFSQTSDREVLDFLERSARPPTHAETTHVEAINKESRAPKEVGGRYSDDQ